MTLKDGVLTLECSCQRKACDCDREGVIEVKQGTVDKDEVHIIIRSNLELDSQDVFLNREQVLSLINQLRRLHILTAGEGL